MAITLGTNAGFVTVAPTGDPSAASLWIDDSMCAVEDTSPATATRITEIGWWCYDATEAANFEVGIYSDDGTGEPHLLNTANRTNAKGTTAGWKRVTGLNIEISGSTVYWIAVQLDSTATRTSLSHWGSGGSGLAQVEGGVATLPSDWGSSDYVTETNIGAIYAVWDTGATGTNMKINIGDVHKDVSEMKINIGDSWKAVAEVKQNIGDVWKTVF